MAYPAQKEGTGNVQQHCEGCRHFQKDEYTGYCRIQNAYVLKTFWCVQFQPASISDGGK